MLQRTLFRASRAAARPILRPASFTPIRQPVAASLRWYSETPAAAKAGETTESKPAEASEVTQLKEAVDKKDKEIVDLKVCTPKCNSTAPLPLPSTQSSTCNILTVIPRTNTSAR